MRMLVLLFNLFLSLFVLVLCYIAVVAIVRSYRPPEKHERIGRALVSPADAIDRHRDEMDRRTAEVLYAVAMVAVIVGVDFAFFRNRFWERLIVNIGIVLVFGAFYMRFFRPP